MIDAARAALPGTTPLQAVVVAERPSGHEMETNAGRNHAEITASLAVFLGCTLDTRRQLLLRGTESVRLRPRSYDVLLHLVRNAGRLVSKQELMDVVWKDVIVTDDSLVQCLTEIRRALGGAEGVIETVRGRGYLSNTEVRWTGIRRDRSPPVRTDSRH